MHITRRIQAVKLRHIGGVATAFSPWYGCDAAGSLVCVAGVWRCGNP